MKKKNRYIFNQIILIKAFDNKVYKNIVDIYTILEKSLYKYSNIVDISTCISGEFSKKLQFSKYDDIFQEILYNMSAEEIDRVESENMVSITAYSELFDENYLEYLGNKINLNIGIRYSEDDDKTLTRLLIDYKTRLLIMRRE